MGNWTVVIQGTGAHHNFKQLDAISSSRMETAIMSVIAAMPITWQPSLSAN